MKKRVLGSETDKELVQEHSTLDIQEIQTPSKLKINKRRGVNNTATVDMEMVS